MGLQVMKGEISTMQTEKTGVIYRIYHKGSMKSYIGKSVRT